MFDPKVGGENGTPKIQKLLIAFLMRYQEIKKPSFFTRKALRVEDGIRTRDPRYHKPML